MFPQPARSLRSVLEINLPSVGRMDDLTKWFPEDLTGKNIRDDKRLSCLFNNNLPLVRSKGGDNPVYFESLKDNYLVIFSMSAPIFTTSLRADICRALIDSYDELKNIEMILVLQMRGGYEHNKGVFDDIFSAFPCLAVPFFQPKARNDICSSIGLPEAIVVHPDGTVLGHPGTLDYFLYYGSDWALSRSPFMSNSIDAIQERDEVLRSRFDPIYALSHPDPSTLPEDPLTLYHILDCDPLLPLYRCNPSAAPCLVHKLSKKHVGLYLCFDGTFMKQLKKAHDRCLENKQKLEIVVVGVSLSDDPISFDKDLLRALKRCNITSWFIFKSNSKVIRRIWRIYGQGFDFRTDRFVVIPPNGVSCELEAKAVIKHIGIDAYPFTRSTIRKQRLKALRSLTPDKLFNNGSLVKKGERFEFNNLQGKKLLIHLCYLERVENKTVYELLKENYPKIKDKGYEVVFVPCDVHGTSEYISRNMDFLPWPYMPYPSSVGVSRQLLFPEEPEHSLTDDFLIYMEEGGRILSRCIYDRLDDVLATQSFSEDLLEEELTTELFGLSEDR